MIVMIIVLKMYGILNVYVDIEASPDKSQAEVDYLKKDLKQLRLDIKAKDEEILMLKFKQSQHKIQNVEYIDMDGLIDGWMD